MYALELKEGELNIDISPFVISKYQTQFTLTPKTVPLYRWDADATHYDFLVQRGMLKTNPQDMIGQIIVYRSHSTIAAGDEQMKILINTLKERLSQ
jgi:hypothetical protein